MPERRYDDEEVGRVLRAAAEMQSGLALPGGTEGATLAELQQIAKEVGLDPAAVSRAARELDSSPRNRSSETPGSVYVELSVDGSLSDEAWDDIISELRRSTGSLGVDRLVGGNREWTDEGFNSTSLTASPRRDRTQLRFLGNTTGSAVVTAMFTFFFLILSTALAGKFTHSLLGPFLTTALILMMVVLGIGTSVGIVRRQRRRFRTRIEELSERVAGIAASHSLDKAVPSLERHEAPVQEIHL
jgi:hypothetical protein